MSIRAENLDQAVDLADDLTRLSTGVWDVNRAENELEIDEEDPNDIASQRESDATRIGREISLHSCVISIRDGSKTPDGNARSEMLNFTEPQLARVKEEQVDIISTPNPSSQRRLRQILDGILLPTLRSVQRRKCEELKEDYEKLKLLKDPKIKKNVAALLPETLKDRLKPIGLEIQDRYFTLDQVSRETTVTRFFMSSKYGGNMQATRPKPSPAFLAIHGMDDFFYLPTEFQPEAPQLPGAPGLWFSTTPGYDFEQVMRVFVKIIPANGPKVSRYQYMGQYEVHPANPPALTVREWSAQPPKFHNTWAQGMVKNGWGSRVRARILLRRELGREPRRREVENAILNKRHMVVIAEEVKGAYFRGEERLGVLTMKCVGYDNRFQQELHDSFPCWAPPPSKSGKKKASATSKPQSTPTTVGKRRPRIFKRKHDPVSDTNSDSEDEAEVKSEVPSEGDSGFDSPVGRAEQLDSTSSIPKPERFKMEV